MIFVNLRINQRFIINGRGDTVYRKTHDFYYVEENSPETLHHEWKLIYIKVCPVEEDEDF